MVAMGQTTRSYGCGMTQIISYTLDTHAAHYRSVGINIHTCEDSGLCLRLILTFNWKLKIK